MKAYWIFYRDVNLFNVLFCIIAGFITSLLWVPVFYCSFGLFAGLFAYYTFFRQQYYFYHNLGYTKPRLALMTLTVNVFIALPIFTLLFLIS